MFKTLLCATDLSKRSAPALTAAAALAERLEADALWLLHAVDFDHGAATNDSPAPMAHLLEQEVAKVAPILELVRSGVAAMARGHDVVAVPVI